MKLSKQQENALLVCKLCVFLYIIVSPLIDHQKYLAFMNMIPVKVILVISIVLSAFVDFQLSILLAIALFVMIINFNKDQIFKTHIYQEEVKKKPRVVVESENLNALNAANAANALNIATLASTPYSTTTTTPLKLVAQDKEYKPDIVPYIGETIHTFPSALCNTKPFEDVKMSNDLLTYYIDDKTKPYEVYIRMLTNQEYLVSAQTNTVPKL